MVLGETLDDDAARRGAARPARPGVLLVLQNGRAAAVPIALDKPLIVGRENRLFVDDERLSRKHVQIERAGVGFRVRDLGSRNGTFLDAERLEGVGLATASSIVRAGRQILLLVDDLDEVSDGVSKLRGAIVGPKLRRTLIGVASAASEGDNLLVYGESGAGKEEVAKTFHACVGKGPLVSVNCATIPTGLAERLLLGARRGAFSGATDTEGWLAAADGGVLFLDEIAELELDVQSKILRVLETSEVTPLGATRAQKVDVRIVFATHRDLRALAAAGKFRADLYYRIEQPVVHVPALRERREEIPALIEHALAGRSAPPVHAAFVETCMLRPWPGNVRELIRNVRNAATRARTGGHHEVSIDHLDEAAGTPLEVEAPGGERETMPEKPAVVDALKRHEGNVSAAARSLRLHRTQLRRLIERYGLDE